MYSKLAALAFAAGVYAQVPPPASTLTSTMSGVLPVAPGPTPFEIPTLEGAIIYDGPVDPGFTGVLGNATEQTGPAVSYQAILPTTNFDPLTGSIITGTVKATSNGTGVVFTFDLSGFPSESEYGPFVYHVHALQVPSDGNCTATLGHLDPTDRGEYHPCQAALPMTCQAGDLAGKHGNITGTSFTASFFEPYLSTDPSSNYFFGDKSIVIHSMNTTRLTCANFAMVSSNSTGTSGSNATTSATPVPTEVSSARVLTVSGWLAGVAMLLALAL